MKRNFIGLWRPAREINLANFLRLAKEEVQMTSWCNNLWTEWLNSGRGIKRFRFCRKGWKIKCELQGKPVRGRGWTETRKKRISKKKKFSRFTAWLIMKSFYEKMKPERKQVHFIFSLQYDLKLVFPQKSESREFLLKCRLDFRSGASLYRFPNQIN